MYTFLITACENIYKMLIKSIAEKNYWSNFLNISFLADANLLL